MASGMYNRFKANLMNKEIDLEADVIRVMLLVAAHSFSAAHNQKSEIVTNEISGTGYTANGEALSALGVTQGATTKWDGNDVQWTGATFSAWHGVIYDDTMTADDLIASMDFSGEKIVSAGTFKIQWHVNGIVTLASV